MRRIDTFRPTFDDVDEVMGNFPENCRDNNAEKEREPAEEEREMADGVMSSISLAHCTCVMKNQ